MLYHYSSLIHALLFGPMSFLLLATAKLSNLSGSFLKDRSPHLLRFTLIVSAVMPKSVTDFLPNVTKQHEVLLFKDYVCIEHYPFLHSQFIGCYICDLLNTMQIELPVTYNYMYFRDDTNHIHTTIKELGDYVLIINNKILFPQND